MNRSYLCLRVRTYISPYRGSICYKRRTSPFQNINIGPQADIEKGAKRVYLPLQYFGMYHGSIYSLKKEKRVLHLGWTNRRGEEWEGGLRALSRCCSRTTHLFLPLRPARWDQISRTKWSDRKRRLLAGNPYSWKPLVKVKGKTKVRSCAPAEERSFGSLPYYYIKRGKGSKPIWLIRRKGRSATWL